MLHIHGKKIYNSLCGLTTKPAIGRALYGRFCMYDSLYIIYVYRPTYVSTCESGGAGGRGGGGHILVYYVCVYLPLNML